ncbi:MAG: cell division protein FtsQ/DivIB [Patescibacteria group bacterium]
MARALTLPSQAKRRRQVAFFRKIILVFVILALFFAAIVYSLRRGAVRISEINIQVEESVGKDGIDLTIRQELAGSYLYAIPKDSIFFYPKKKIEDTLVSRFKRLGKAEISVNNFNSINVRLEEHTPRYVWCDNQSFETAPCYFMDSNGFVFDKSPAFSGNVYIRFYGTLLGDDTDIIGKKFLAQDIFKELDTFINAISDKVFSLSQLIKNEDQDYELYLKDGGKIIFSLEDGAGKSLSNLFSALETDPLKANLRNKPKSLEYIDLRFGNKVFYKFK